MVTLKNNGLRACIALMVILFGVFVAVKAMERKEEVKAEPKSLVNQTWYFNGTSSDDPTDESLYVTTPPSDGCITPYQKICEVQAPDDGNGHPDMDAPVGSQTVRDQINAAQASLSNPGGPSTNSTVTAFRKN